MLELLVMTMIGVGVVVAAGAYQRRRGPREQRLTESWDWLCRRYELSDNHRSDSSYRRLVGEAYERAAVVEIDVDRNSGGSNNDSLGGEFSNVTVEFDGRDYSDIAVRPRGWLDRISGRFGGAAEQSQFGFKKMAYQGSEPPVIGEGFDDKFELVGEASDEICWAVADEQVIDALSELIGRNDLFFIEGGSIRFRCPGVADADAVSRALDTLSTVADVVEQEVG